MGMNLDPPDQCQDVTIQDPPHGEECAARWMAMWEPRTALWDSALLDSAFFSDPRVNTALLLVFFIKHFKLCRELSFLCPELPHLPVPPLCLLSPSPRCGVDGSEFPSSSDSHCGL